MMRLRSNCDTKKLEDELLYIESLEFLNDSISLMITYVMDTPYKNRVLTQIYYNNIDTMRKDYNYLKILLKKDLP